jgi:hypothetical protein
MNMSNHTATKNEKKSVSLAQALRDWEKSATDRFAEHLTSPQLQRFLKGPLEATKRQAILKHLSYCRKCRDQLWEMDAKASAKESILDVALPKAAASQQSASFSLVTEGKRYRIVFRKLLNQEGKGLVTLSVENPYREEMEGKRVVVMDSAGKEIIRDKVRRGETSGRIVNAAEINWESIIVREDLSPETDEQ